jgi:hypothetical protein
MITTLRDNGPMFSEKMTQAVCRDDAFDIKVSNISTPDLPAVHPSILRTEDLLVMG